MFQKFNLILNKLKKNMEEFGDKIWMLSPSAKVNRGITPEIWMLSPSAKVNRGITPE